MASKFSRRAVHDTDDRNGSSSMDYEGSGFDDYYSSSYEYELEPEYYHYLNDYNYGKVNKRRPRKSKGDQMVSSFSYSGYPYASRRSDGYGSHSGHSGGGYGHSGGGKCKCCCNDDNDLATLAALGFGFLALSGQLQNILMAITGGRRRRKRATHNSEVTSGKKRAQKSFSILLLLVRQYPLFLVISTSKHPLVNLTITLSPYLSLSPYCVEVNTYFVILCRITHF